MVALSPNRQGVPLGGYMVYVVLISLGRNSTYGVQCPRKAGNYTALPDTNDICTPTAGDTCGTECIHQDPNFVCSVHNETGWRQYQTRYRTDRFNLTNGNGPALVAIAMHNQTLHPALSVTINISAEIPGTSVTPSPIPRALLVRVSGVNDSDSVRDDLYTDTPLYRLYRFTTYTPTTHDHDNPRQALLKCNHLDACSVKVYRLEITAFVPDSRLMTRTVYTITAPNNRGHGHHLPPVIATALHPRNNSVTVVFETGRDARVATVALVKVYKTQVLYSQNVSSETSSVTFQTVTAGLYTATIEIAGNKYHSYQFCVGNSEQLHDEYPGAFYSEDMNDELIGTHPRYVVPALASVLFIVFTGAVVAAVLYMYRYRLIRLIKHNHQTPQVLSVEKVTRILLLNRYQDQQMARYLMDFVETHFPWVNFVSVEEQGADTDTQSNMLVEKAVRSCDQIIVIWSPPPAVEEDIFEETITNESLFTCKNDVELCVIFSSDHVDSTSLPVEFNGARKFDLTTDLESFCQYSFSRCPESSESIREFHNSPLYKNLIESYTKVSDTKQVEVEVESDPLLETISCAVHGIKNMHNTNFNIERSETETWQEDSESNYLTSTICPIHGPQQMDISREYNSGQDSISYNEHLHPTPTSLESRMLLLNGEM